MATTVAIDRDGQAYLYWGNPDLWRVSLNPDMVSYSGAVEKVTPRITNYQEGPWFYRRGDHYYMAFASTCSPEGIGYAMSSAPTGPWVYRGAVMDHNKGSSGNHPGIIDYQYPCLTSISGGFPFESPLTAAVPRQRCRPLTRAREPRILHKVALPSSGSRLLLGPMLCS